MLPRPALDGQVWRLARDIDRLGAGTNRTRATDSAPPRTAPCCARADDGLRSAAVSCPPWWTATWDIRILLLETQIKYGSIPPARHHTLELEVRFCVRGVIHAPLVVSDRKKVSAGERSRLDEVNSDVARVLVDCVGMEPRDSTSHARMQVL